MTVTTTRSHLGVGSLAREQAVGAAAQLALLAVLGLTAGLGAAGWAAGLAYAAGLWALLGGAVLRARACSLGPADRVTLTRAVLIGGVTALVVDHLNGGAPPAVVVPLASVALVLDAVDGWVARRTGTSSALGARFDMEADAFLILVLSVLVAMTSGPWVLAIGLMRYAFVAAAQALPWLRAPLPPSRARKVVAALQGVLLVAAGSGLFPAGFAFAVTAFALLLLVWSFGRDVVWLFRAGSRRVAPLCRMTLVIASRTTKANGGRTSASSTASGATSSMPAEPSAASRPPAPRPATRLTPRPAAASSSGREGVSDPGEGTSHGHDSSFAESSSASRVRRWSR